MTTTQAFETSSRVSEDELAGHLVDLADTVSSTCAESFNAMLPRVVERVVGPGQACDDAIANGGFVLNDCTVVMRLNAETDSVEFFCDVGLPVSHSLEQTYRAALELNLCRTHDGITFGIHPESGRLVATTAMHALLIADDEVCVNTLHMLTRVVSQLRDERAFDLAP